METGSARRTLPVGNLIVNDKVYQIYEGVNTVGRDVNCTVVLKAPTISKLHAQIIVIGNEHHVSDFHSTNKTQLETKVLVPMKCYKLQSKSTITFGDLETMYTVLENFVSPRVLKKRFVTHDGLTQVINNNDVSLNAFEDTSPLLTETCDDMLTQVMDDHKLSTPKPNAKVTFDMSMSETLDIHEVPTQIFDNSPLRNESANASFTECRKEKSCLNKSLLVKSLQNNAFDEKDTDSSNDSILVPSTQAFTENTQFAICNKNSTTSIIVNETCDITAYSENLTLNELGREKKSLDMNDIISDSDESIDFTCRVQSSISEAISKNVLTNNDTNIPIDMQLMAVNVSPNKKRLDNLNDENNTCSENSNLETIPLTEESKKGNERVDCREKEFVSAISQFSKSKLSGNNQTSGEVQTISQKSDVDSEIITVKSRCKMNKIVSSSESDSSESPVVRKSKVKNIKPMINSSESDTNFEENVYQTGETCSKDSHSHSENLIIDEDGSGTNDSNSLQGETVNGSTVLENNQTDIALEENENLTTREKGCLNFERYARNPHKTSLKNKPEVTQKNFTSNIECNENLNMFTDTEVDSPKKNISTLITSLESETEDVENIHKIQNTLTETTNVDIYDMPTQMFTVNNEYSRENSLSEIASKNHDEKITLENVKRVDEFCNENIFDVATQVCEVPKECTVEKYGGKKTLENVSVADICNDNIFDAPTQICEVPNLKKMGSMQTREVCLDMESNVNSSSTSKLDENDSCLSDTQIIESKSSDNSDKESLDSDCDNGDTAGNENARNRTIKEHNVKLQNESNKKQTKIIIEERDLDVGANSAEINEKVEINKGSSCTDDIFDIPTQVFVSNSSERSLKENKVEKNNIIFEESFDDVEDFYGFNKSVLEKASRESKQLNKEISDLTTELVSVNDEFVVSLKNIQCNIGKSHNNSLEEPSTSKINHDSDRKLFKLSGDKELSVSLNKESKINNVLFENNPKPKEDVKNTHIKRNVHNREENELLSIDENPVNKVGRSKRVKKVVDSKSPEVNSPKIKAANSKLSVDKNNASVSSKHGNESNSENQIKTNHLKEKSDIGLECKNNTNMLNITSSSKPVRKKSVPKRFRSDLEESSTPVLSDEDNDRPIRKKTVSRRLRSDLGENSTVVSNEENTLPKKKLKDALLANPSSVINAKEVKNNSKNEFVNNSPVEKVAKVILRSSVSSDITNQLKDVSKRATRKTMSTVSEHRNESMICDSSASGAKDRLNLGRAREFCLNNVQNEKKEKQTSSSCSSSTIEKEDLPRKTHTRKLKTETEGNYDLKKKNESSSKKETRKRPAVNEPKCDLPQKVVCAEADSCSPRRSQQRDKYSILFTKYQSDVQESIARKLGGKIVTSVTDGNVLVTEEVRRTPKLLSFVAQGKPIVSPRWLLACDAANKFLDPWDFLLIDKKAESNFDFQLQHSLIKASKGLLLNGWTVMVTPAVMNADIKEMIENSGGKCISRCPSTFPANSFVISSQSDSSRWSTILKKKPKPVIVSPEAIFSGLLRQKLELERYSIN